MTYYNNISIRIIFFYALAIFKYTPPFSVNIKA